MMETCQHKQLKHVCEFHMFVSGQQYSSEFGELNIVAKIPVMKDGGFTLSERYSRASSFSLALFQIV